MELNHKKDKNNFNLVYFMKNTAFLLLALESLNLLKSSKILALGL